MNPDGADGALDPGMEAALAQLDPHLAAAMTALVLALVVCVFLLALLSEDDFRR